LKIGALQRLRGQPFDGITVDGGKSGSHRAYTTIEKDGLNRRDFLLRSMPYSMVARPLFLQGSQSHISGVRKPKAPSGLSVTAQLKS
jgi:hypothetical protein